LKLISDHIRYLPLSFKNLLTSFGFVLLIYVTSEFLYTFIKISSIPINSKSGHSVIKIKQPFLIIRLSILSFEALQQKAAATDQQELLTSVSGGTFGACHPCQECVTNQQNSQGRLGILAMGLLHLTHTN